MMIDTMLKRKLSGENQPAFISEEDMNDPFLVISDYFNGTHVLEHQRRCSNWIYAVFGNHIWDVKEPGELVFFFKETMILIEAAFALHILKATGKESHANTEKYFRPLRGRTGYALIPHYLTDEEEANPYLVLAALGEYDLSEYRTRLLDWLEWALQSTGIEDSEDDLYFFDLLQKLVEALYILNMQVALPNELLTEPLKS